MPSLRIALAQVNSKVGDLDGNARQVRQSVGDAAGRGAQLVAFPEMMLTGYPVEDLALRPSFQQASLAAARGLAADLATDGHGDIACIVGYLDHEGAPVNAVAVMHRGTIVARYVKHHLPNYGVFDEARYFRSGQEPVLLRLGEVTVALAICEDLWQAGGPVEWAREAQAGLLLVVNASPYERGKDDTRLALCSSRAVESGCTLAYVNLFGGQDELVFDGDSIIVDPSGAVLARAPQFESCLLVTDLELPVAPPSGAAVELVAAPVPSGPAAPGSVAPRLPELQEVYQALVCGLGDYVNKNGFPSVILGLSGGIDSALVAAIACDALGADRVYGVSLPSEYSSDHSMDDADDLATRCGLHLRTVPIAPMVDAFLATLGLTGLAEENLQARVRGTTLMGISNQEGHLVLTTGNKSELSVGYSTLYGDSVGGFAPIKDVPKTLVWALSRWRNEFAAAQGLTPPIPPNSIVKEPSAELRPGQLDSDSLPDYAVLDAILEGYVSADQGASALVDAGFDADLVERVLRMTDTAEYKRRQFPPGTKISLRAFGRDRRLPITNGWRETAR
ncbi:MAG: NAD+ synthase [Actinobacteria bacterium]|uniref:NAD(+) synthase (glutamine-hydrolyzing) n=1 Tax=freshwater metagenome TaxID=449393 RepID=A0A6J7E9Q7_9ZZZZ|nr:NAD+ synthase [Actinomycetota bacterium]